MQSTRPETSPVKAGRRVLGEKNINASLTPSAKRHADKHNKPSIDTIPFNPLKGPRKDREDVSHHAGQKRTIDQVTDSETEDAEPRKAVVTAQPGADQDFQIFDDNNDNTRPNSPSREISPTGVAIPAQASKQLIPSQRNTSLVGGQPEVASTSIPASSVPTEPAARRIFIQEKAALVRQRLQSAMHRVGNNSLDRALSQFEASSRPLVPRGSAVLSSSSSSRVPSSSPSSFAAAATKTTTASQKSPTQKRVLLPPLPIQPQSRPVRASAAARTSISSSFSESASYSIVPQEEEAEEEREVEDEEQDDDDEGEETPKAAAENQQRPETNVKEMKAALDEANALHKLKELAQSSTNAEQTVGR
ncbi:hypothetical protein PISL3812_02916 [Talaromyces islandicus]|uniref:Uncharacterized protein n=1 Tax=Talaromyces islandicus TaxID=28573 RepID=A0A0U1LR78_TALIS|nr:hypothetical protein PISL3812_02916 [Talaromyces islandicus]